MASRQNYLPRSLMLYDSSSDSSDDSIANELNMSPSNVWVFGYGSLCWNPGFEFSKCVTGYVRGYVRRFWQGNTTHRGTTEKVTDTVESLIVYFTDQIFSKLNFIEIGKSENFFELNFAS